MVECLVFICLILGMASANAQYSGGGLDHSRAGDMMVRGRSTSSRHQPTPKILSSDQVFRAEEGDTLGSIFQTISFKR